MADPAVLSSEETLSMNDFLLIATVLKPQGVRGECKLRSYAADIDAFQRWHTLYQKSETGFLPVSLNLSRIRDGFVYAFLNGSSSMEDAEAFRGADLYVSRSDLAPVGEDAVLIADLIGCELKDADGRILGVLTDVLQYGTVDTWVFTTPGGTLMAPALKAVFPLVDAERKTILTDPEKLEEVSVRS